MRRSARPRRGLPAQGVGHGVLPPRARDRPRLVAGRRRGARDRRRARNRAGACKAGTTGGHRIAHRRVLVRSDDRPSGGLAVIAVRGAGQRWPLTRTRWDTFICRAAWPPRRISAASGRTPPSRHRLAIAGAARAARPAPSFRRDLGDHLPAMHLCTTSHAAAPFPGWSVLNPRSRERDGRKDKGGGRMGDKFLGRFRPRAGWKLGTYFASCARNRKRFIDFNQIDLEDILRFETDWSGHDRKATNPATVLKRRVPASPSQNHFQMPLAFVHFLF